MSITPATQALKARQGSTYRDHIVVWIGTPKELFDFSDCSARMQVRDKDTDALLATLSSVIEETADGTITLGGALGTIDLFVDEAVTELWTPATYKYDLEIDTGDDVFAIFEGPFKVYRQWTR